MKEATNVVTLFLLSVAQFIIGVLIVAGKANINTIGWYYIFVSTFVVLMAILTTVGIALRGDKK